LIVLPNRLPFRPVPRVDPNRLFSPEDRPVPRVDPNALFIPEDRPAPNRLSVGVFGDTVPKTPGGVAMVEV
jgi:hypothetical protein